MRQIRIDKLTSMLIVFSMLLYSMRGNAGAIAIVLAIPLYIYMISREKKQWVSGACVYAASFIFVFAFLSHIIRTLQMQYYLVVGYLFVVIVLMERYINNYNYIWEWLKKIAIFESVGIFIQRILPNIYYIIISVVLPVNSVSSIRNRLSEGYYTGFTREVSFTMVFIIIGLGLYLFDQNLRKREKVIPLILLIGGLLMSGKRATLFFFIIALVITYFLKSESKLKIIKYALYVIVIVVLTWITYPFWSKIQVFSRVNELITYIKLNDIVGITNGRTIIYDNAIKLWKDSKWFGIGWGNFKYTVSKALWYSGFDVHNCFIQILCENGIVGLSFYIILIVISIKNSIQSVKRIRLQDYKAGIVLFACFFQIFFILYSLTEPILFEYSDYIMYFICFNICAAYIKNSNFYRKKE